MKGEEFAQILLHARARRDRSPAPCLRWPDGILETRSAEMQKLQSD